MDPAMLLLERAWGNEPGLLTLLVLCAALACQRAWALDHRQGVPFLRSRWAQLCVVTLVGGSVALGIQLFDRGSPAPLAESRAVAAPLRPAVAAAAATPAVPAEVQASVAASDFPTLVASSPN